MNKLSGSEIVAKIEKTPDIKIEVIATGPRGKKGEQGQEGKSAYETWLDLGNAGTEQDFINYLRLAGGYIHNQSTPSAEWVIEHGLLKYPSVSIVESTDNLVFGNVEYIDMNSLKVSFAGAFSGKAYLN